MKRLWTLALLTLVWLLTSPTPAWAHCHASITYGPGGSGDCGQASFWGSLAIATVLTAFYFAPFLSIYYRLNRDTIKRPGRMLTSFWRKLRSIPPELVVKFGRNDEVGNKAEIAMRSTEALPSKWQPIGPIAEVAIRFVHWVSAKGGPRWFNNWADRLGRMPNAQDEFNNMMNKRIQERVWIEWLRDR
ncbi:hypothetical protein ABGB14_47240 [Nonomuraea sp. B10E15]|uniref:hypothetical protein n=1 Tax=Nonomuraea sp. B10E15 TaxID=3153560 RepID=UPI00325F7041